MTERRKWWNGRRIRWSDLLAAGIGCVAAAVYYVGDRVQGWW